MVDGNGSEYWWTNDPSERYWIEVRKLPGTGIDLRCSVTNQSGHEPGQYKLVGEVREGDVVYHWHAEQSRFVGRSVADEPARLEGNERVVRLRDFNPLVGDVSLEDVRAYEADMYEVRSRLAEAYPGQTLYLPFQYRSDGLRMVSYYFAKLPREIVELLFGQSGWADAESEDPPQEEGPAEEPEILGVQRGYLQPWKPKADSDYETFTKTSTRKRGRKHETLVNRFSEWLAEKGRTPLRNRAIDIGLQEPPAIVEAKIAVSWAQAIRQAVGQLYEYRYFQVVSPQSGLIFLASKPVPDKWRQYLENDRGIAVAWADGNGFVLSGMALKKLGL